jgi:hypothetical protein
MRNVELLLLCAGLSGLISTVRSTVLTKLCIDVGTCTYQLHWLLGKREKEVVEVGRKRHDVIEEASSPASSESAPRYWMKSCSENRPHTVQ